MTTPILILMTFLIPILAFTPIYALKRRRALIDIDNEWKIKISPNSGSGYCLRVYKNDINVTEKIRPNRGSGGYIISDWIPIFGIERKAAIRLGKKLIRQGIAEERNPNKGRRDETIEINTNPKRRQNSRHYYDEPIANYLPPEISKLSAQYSKGEIDLEEFETGAHIALAKTEHS